MLVIYFNNPKSLNAGLLTIFTNRLGDGILLSGAILRFWTLNFNIFLAEPIFSPDFFFLFLFVIGAITKRAQIPFSAWLPAAIAAPTPVSSLVHSSTLVTAGIYILFRARDLIPSSMLAFLLTSGVLTILMARISALSESDMKKIVALSTLRQLGLMMTALGRGLPYLGFFHLITHAFFKALIFIAVGNIIHSSERYQELKIIGKRYFFPVSIGVITGANLRLCGLPFFSGFFRKEIIIQTANISHYFSLFLYFLLVVRIVLTQLYRLRFIAKVFLTSRNFLVNYNFEKEDFYCLKAFSILIIPACTAGRFLRFTFKPLSPFFIDPIILKLILISILLIAVLVFILTDSLTYTIPKS